MVYKFGLLLLAGYVSVTSALPPCVCTRNLEPVCGSDGVTYANECLLQCAQTTKSDLTLKKQGPCEAEPPACFCTFNYKPVCGTDGKNYPNECALNCEKAKILGLEVKSIGECPKEQVKVANIPSVSCVCPLLYDPICGTDGKTYPNECVLNCAKANTPGLEVKSKGECPKEQFKVANIPSVSCACPLLYHPMCGTDGKTYPNECVLNCEKANTPGLELKSEGECPKEEVKVAEIPCVCTREMKPVCGSDGTTYNNPCLLRCASEKSTTKIQVDHTGPCDDGLKVTVVDQPAPQTL